MSTIEQLHIGLVKAIKEGFLPTYLVKETYWDNGVAVLQTRHLTIEGLKGPAVHIPAPTNTTLHEIRDALSEGVWYSGAARWTAAQALKGHKVWAKNKDTLMAVCFPSEGALRIEAIQQFEARKSLEFISIYAKYYDGASHE